MDYSHLGLRDWPFRIVPEPTFCDFLADRSTLSTDLENFLIALENRPTSDIQLLWSWNGAGKTHTLFYLANRCVSSHDRLLPIYVELPREASGFFDLYRATMSQFPVESIVDGYLERRTRPDAKTAFGRSLDIHRAGPQPPGGGVRTAFARAFDPDLNSALTQAAVGEKSTEVLLGQWLLGNPLAASALRTLGVGGRVNTTEKCAAVLADVISLLAPRRTANEPGLRRVIWVIDEVQRVEKLADAAKRSMLSGMVGVFNRCATGLTLLLSYTGVPREKGLPEWIPLDLADRIGLERPMLLPPLSHDEARTFIRDLIRHFRLPNHQDLGPYFPFEADAIEDLLRALARDDSLKPRSIMEALDASLRHLEPAIRAGSRKTIDIQSMRSSLERFALKWVDSAKRAKR